MMNKKLKIFLTLLLIVNLILNLIAPEISKISFIGIWVTAMAFWGIVCIQEKTIHLMRQIKKIDREIFGTELELIRLLNSRINDLEAGCGIKEYAEKISAMSKVTSATGQTYVDFDDVMCILEGGDIVER